MSLLDSVLETENQIQEKLSPAEAFAAITLATTAVDGYLSEEEELCISSVLSRMKLFRSFSHDVMHRLFERILEILRQDGFNSLFNAARESLSPDLREAAFALATDLLLADGTGNDEEKVFLTDLYQALGVSRETALQIVQVMSIKNRG
jgi:tellurite resistance protein